VTGQINGVADIKPAVLHPAGCIGFFCAKQVGVDHDKTIVSSGRRNTGNGVRSAWCRRGALPVDAVDVVGKTLVVGVGESDVRTVREVICVNDITGVVNVRALGSAGSYGTSCELANRCLSKSEAHGEHRKDQCVKVLHYVFDVGFVGRI